MQSRIKHRLGFALASLVSVAMAPLATAMVDLELTQGVAAAIPLALQVTRGDEVKVPGEQTVLEVMRNDLENSGEFRIVNRGQAMSASANAQTWQQLGADYLVSGTVESVGGDRYKIHIRLNNVFKGDTTLGDGQVLMDADFIAAKPALRAAVHRLDDEIYKKLTGVRGVFSTRIAYVMVQHPTPRSSRYALEVADADGFNPRVLLTSSEPIMSPAWTPDGREIAYVSFEGHRAAIYRQNIATGQRSKVSAAPGINGAPSFSPDGRYMAMVLSKTGNPNLYLMDLGSGQMHALTSGWSIDTEPRFSADGQKLLFTSNRDGTPQIYEYRLASGQVQRVSYSGNYNARPSYVPFTHDVIMMHRADRLFGIARLSLDNGQVDTLIQTGADESPSVAPNGKMIIYATQYGGRGVLAQVSVDGRIKLRLPAQEGSVQEPAWSPFLT